MNFKKRGKKKKKVLLISNFTGYDLSEIIPGHYMPNSCKFCGYVLSSPDVNVSLCAVQCTEHINADLLVCPLFRFCYNHSMCKINRKIIILLTYFSRHFIYVVHRH